MRLRHTVFVPTSLSFSLGGSNRLWLTLRGGSNPLSASDGPLPGIGIPLEVRTTEREIEIDILRLAFDLSLGNLVIGQGELGPLTTLHTSESYVVAVARCPRTALPHLLDPPPPQGRITLKLLLRGLLRYRHDYRDGDARGQGLREPGVWHIEAVGQNGVLELEVQVARSDWYEQVVAKLGIGGYLIAPLRLPSALATWRASLGHLDSAERAVVEAKPSAVFAACRAAIDALPGDKIEIFAAMPEGTKRDAIDELTKRLGKYLHSGRHVVPNNGDDLAGDFPVDLCDAVFAYNMTKLLLSHIASLTIIPG